MNKVMFKGIIPPCITPFDERGIIDRGAIKILAEFWAEKVDGLFICGTYGCGPLMTLEERKEVAELFVQTIKNRVPVIVHVGAVTSGQAVELAKHAEAIGVTAVSAVPPYYYEHSTEAIKRYYAALVEAVNIPVYAYNNPKTTRNPISPELMAELAGLGVAGMKDSSFDILYFYAVKRKVKKTGFQCIMGSEALVVPAFLSGAQACVPGMGNCLPEPVRELVDLCFQGEWAKAMEKQQFVLKVRELMHIGPTHVVVQEVLKMRGIPAGLPRAPFVPLNDEQKRKLRIALTELEVLE